MVSISRSMIDAINLVGVLLSVLGFFYLTYVLFGRKALKWFVRVITPSLIGAIILTIVGVFEFAYIVRGADIGMILRNGVLYALIGALIGAFNGIFVEWPLASEKPNIFSWKGFLIGSTLMFFISLLLAFLYNLPPERSLFEGVILAPLGGIAGGVWQFVNWAPSTSADKAPSFAWIGCLIGLVSAFLFGFLVSLVLGRPPFLGLLAAGILAPTGGIAGGLWQFFTKDSTSPSDSASENMKNGKEYVQGDNLLPEKTRLLDEMSSFKKSSIMSGDNSDIMLYSLIEWEYTKGGILVPKGSSLTNSPLEASLSSNKAPLFSLRGCLIGLISAFLFGFFLALVVDITFGNALIGSLRAALTAASLIGPAGALTGGISRFIYWRANSLSDNQLGGIGAGLTLFGFLLQSLPPLVDILNIPVR